jgi:CRP-like cAMP-binding protein
MLRATARFGVNRGDGEAELTSLRGPELDELLRAGRMRSLAPAAVLCEEGQHCDHCWVVAQGTVEVARTVDGSYRTLSQHGPGSVLALLAALDGGPCRVSLRASGNVRVVEIPRDGLFAIFGESDACTELAHRLAITAIRRLRGATDELAQAIHRSLTSAERPGHLAISDLAAIHAGNHAWKAAA